MLAAGLQCRRPDQKVFLRHTLCGQDIRDHRLALGDGAGLIERHDLHIAGLLQGFRRLVEDTVFGAHTVAHHDRDRSRKAKGAGAADHQDGNAARQSKADRLMQDHQPDKGHHQGNTDDRRHKDAGNGVRQLCNGSLGGCRVADHLDDLGKRAVFADAGRLTAKETGLVEGR